jgi:hypothetical protein
MSLQGTTGAPKRYLLAPYWYLVSSRRRPPTRSPFSLSLLEPQAKDLHAEIAPKLSLCALKRHAQGTTGTHRSTRTSGGSSPRRTSSGALWSSTGPPREREASREPPPLLLKSEGVDDDCVIENRDYGFLQSLSRRLLRRVGQGVGEIFRPGLQPHRRASMARENYSAEKSSWCLFDLNT